jgi:hypothetical protein
MIPFAKEEVVFAKNGDEFITLFNGQKEAKLPKKELKHLQLLGRMENQESGKVQQLYDEKNSAEDAKSARDPRRVRDKNTS